MLRNAVLAALLVSMCVSSGCEDRSGMLGLKLAHSLDATQTVHGAMVHLNELFPPG